MKTFAACLVLLVVVALTQAQTAPATTEPKAPATKPGAPKAAPAAKKTDAKKSTSKEEEKEGKIDGMVLGRPNGHFLGLTLQDGRYKLTFYDKKKKPEKVDVTRATARWPNVHGPGDHRTILNPGGDGTYLIGAQFVRGPHSFKLTLVLLRGEGDAAQAVENYTVDFRG